MTTHRHKSRSTRGFTLVEAVMVLVISGIVAAVVAKFIVAPVQGYADLRDRGELTDVADTALRRMARDMRLAVPNSVRVSGNTRIEFLRSSMGGRYRADIGSPAAGGTGSEDILDFNNPADTSFALLGPSMTFAATTSENQNQLVVYNLGIPGADAYNGNTGATDNRRAYAGAAGSVNSVTIAVGSPAKAIPFDSPAHRFQVIDTPVTFACDTTAGTLTRYWGYTIASSMSVPPAGTSKSSLLATNVTGCVFSYAQVNERYGLVSLTLSIAKNNETVTLYHEVHVSNVP